MKKFQKDIIDLMSAFDDIELIKSHYFNIGYEFYEIETEYLIYEYFHGYGVAPDELAIITINYDLGAERAIETIKGMNSFYYPGFQEIGDIRDKVPIMKLHGSINWMEDHLVDVKIIVRRR